MPPAVVNRTKASGQISVDISSDANTSGAYRKDVAGLFGLIFPACTGTDVTVQVSDDGATFAPLYDESGTIVTFTGLAASPVAWTLPVAASPYRYFRLEFTSNQAADRTISVSYMG